MTAPLPIHRVDLLRGPQISVTYSPAGTPTPAPSLTPTPVGTASLASSMYTLIPPASPTAGAQTFWVPPPSPHQQPSFQPRLRVQGVPGATTAAAIAAATAASTTGASPVVVHTAPASAAGTHRYVQPERPGHHQEQTGPTRMQSAVETSIAASGLADEGTVVPLSQKAAMAEAKKAITSTTTVSEVNTPLVPRLELSAMRGAFKPEDTTSTWDPADPSSPPGHSTADSSSGSSSQSRTPRGLDASSVPPSTPVSALGVPGTASPRRETPSTAHAAESGQDLAGKARPSPKRGTGGGLFVAGASPATSPRRPDAAARPPSMGRAGAGAGGVGRAGSKGSSDAQQKAKGLSSTSATSGTPRQTCNAAGSHRPPRWAPPAAESEETFLDPDAEAGGKSFRPPPRNQSDLPALLSQPKVLVDGEEEGYAARSEQKAEQHKVSGSDMAVAAKLMVAPRPGTKQSPSAARGEGAKRSPRGPPSSARERPAPGLPLRETRRHSSPQPQPHSQPHPTRTLKPPTPRLHHNYGLHLGPPHHMPPHHGHGPQPNGGSSCPSSLRAPASSANASTSASASPSASPSSEEGRLFSPHPGLGLGLGHGLARATSPGSAASAARRAAAERSAGLMNAKDVLQDPRKFRQLAQDWFKRLDADRNGSLSFEELVRGIKLLNRALGIGEFRERDVARFMRRFDTNGDGILSAAEFYQVYRYLLLAKVHEEEVIPFCRNMFLGRRMGQPSDHYDIMDTIGQGSFGVVKKILCKDTRALRVLKSIDKEAASKSGLSPKAVIQEIDKLKALDHPAVLRLFEYFADSHHLHLVTDHLPGGELNAIIEQSHIGGPRPSEDWLQQVFRQVCCGVAYCHGKGVMHRDLKLENIMLGGMSPPEAIIIDMGLAELFPPKQGDSHRCKAPTGSIPTMAPEVFRHSSTYKCDVWSLGCCLFAMFCEKPTWFKSRSGRTDFYGYPFMPPKDHSKPQLEEYLRRQRAGPKIDMLWSQSPVEAICSMLTFEEELRPTIPQVLGLDWLKTSQPPGNLEPEGPTKVTLQPEELDCLMSFHRCSALDEVMLLSLASQLPFSELSSFRDSFLRLDADGDGRLDAYELTAAMREAGVGADCATEAARKLTKLGPVEFSRFVAALVPSRPELLTVYLKDAFNRLDTDGDGIVTASELRGILEQKQLPGAAGAGLATTRVLESLDDTSSRPRRNSVSFECLSQHASALCA